MKCSPKEQSAAMPMPTPVDPGSTNSLQVPKSDVTFTPRSGKHNRRKRKAALKSEPLHNGLNISNSLHSASLERDPCHLDASPEGDVNIKKRIEDLSLSDETAIEKLKNAVQDTFESKTDSQGFQLGSSLPILDEKADNSDCRVALNSISEFSQNLNKFPGFMDISSRNKHHVMAADNAMFGGFGKETFSQMKRRTILSSQFICQPSREITSHILFDPLEQRSGGEHGSMNVEEDSTREVVHSTETKGKTIQNIIKTEGASSSGTIERKANAIHVNEECKPLLILPSSLGTVRTGCFRKKLLVLDLNGLLADIVPFGGDHRPNTLTIGSKAVFRRPFYKDFLQFCFERFNVGVWSSRVGRNVVRVLEFLMGNGRHNLLFCWDQSHCTATSFKTIEDKNKPLVLKELKKLWEKQVPNLPWDRGEYDESNTLLLDDSPYKALCNPPNTAIFPQSYNHWDRNDNSLGPGGDLRVYLEGLALAENVQKYVEQNPFGQLPITESNVSWQFYVKESLQQMTKPRERSP